MARRRGRFGRLPRAVPTITNTIIAIAREMQQQRDKNIMDAWQHGGTFEGRPVTDDMVLSHWRGRLKNVDPRDPLFDTYKNAVFQYEYAIAESKVATSYAQGKIGEMAVAKFYLSWAKKVPKDSEFYRVLQRDAAQFMRAAKGRGGGGGGRRGGGAQARENAYYQAQERDYNQYAKPGEYLTDVLRNVARAHALIGGGADTDITEFDSQDPAKMMNLINTINGVGFFAGGKGGLAGDSNVLYRDPVTGQPVTAADVKASLQAIDPNFDGRVTLGYFRGLIQQQMQGRRIMLERAENTGHKTDANAMRKQIEYAGEVGREVALWPVTTSYQQARSLFLSTWQSGTATPDEKMEAWKRYSGRLTDLAGDPLIDDNTRSRLLAEVNGDGSVDSLAEDFIGLDSTDHTTPEGGFKGDIADTAFDVQRLFAMQEAVAKGEAVWTVGQTDQNGIFRPAPGGAEVGAATVADIQASSPVAPVVVFVPQGNGAKTIPVVVSGVQVTTVARDAFGEGVQPTDKNPVGSAYDVVVGGMRTRVFSYQGADGHTYYTTDTPWDDSGVRMRQTPDGIQLDVSAYVPRQDENGTWVHANGQPADMSGSGPFGLSEPTLQGNQHLVFNPSAAVYLSDPVRATAGPDPSTDFFSPTLAALSSSDEGLRVLSELRDDPQFKAQLQFEAYSAAGFQLDSATGAWMGGDQAAFDKFSQQGAMITHLPEIGSTIKGLIDRTASLWDRGSTLPTFSAVQATRGGFSRPGVDDYEATRGQAGRNFGVLPSDQIRGTGFGPLAEVFEAGTNLFKAVTGLGPKVNGPEVKVDGTIRLPQAPNINIKPPTQQPINYATDLPPLVGGLVAPFLQPPPKATKAQLEYAADLPPLVGGLVAPYLQPPPSQYGGGGGGGAGGVGNKAL